MFTSLLRNRKLMALLFLAIGIRLFSLNPSWVERFYTYGVYPHISGLLRILFGWLPLSIGDLLYFSAGIYLLVKLVKYGRLLFQKRLRENLNLALLARILVLVLSVYVVFNLLWGLNYNRQGISAQLGLEVKKYPKEDLVALTRLLHDRLNAIAPKVDSVRRSGFNRNNELFRQAVRTYDNASHHYTYLHYDHPSIKPSLYSHVGQYFGFTGYYNPFTGEAQLKTTTPVFLKPFIVSHEIAHQLGYGKENEANFVAFLVNREAPHIDFRYSIYFEMNLYAMKDLSVKDSLLAKELKATWHPRVQADYNELKEYLLKNRNVIEPYMSRFYDQYLKLNEQPKGQLTYNEVVTWLIAYMKKFGKDRI